MSDPVRVAVLFDRYPLFMDAVEATLRTRGIQVAAKATTPDDALESIEEHDADLLVAVIDASSDFDEATAFLREAAARRPALKVVVLSDGSDSRLLRDAFAAGAAAVIEKTASPDDVVVAIRQAYDPSIHLKRAHLPKREAETALTDREVEILRLVSCGMSNAEVGRTLRITEPTVKFHVSNIFRKLNVTNRTHASRLAHLMNLLPDDEPDRRASGMVC